MMYVKAQVLVRWALQNGYLCAPRSGSKKRVERIAIKENSYNGVKEFLLTKKQMTTLQSLDEQLPAGQLGRRDGWTNDDVTDSKWDPTLAV